MTARHCTHCGGTDLRRGALETGRAGADWADADAEPGWRGALLNQRSRLRVTAYRCESCAHIELFADVPMQ
ncbi:hypothetical protein [Nocardia cyriacigeorgica]|uniref:hypothetical protein n=1 Tax=Nocardia cyriacigeorgica TaxID=135487 RepID=UPI002457EF7C|nr:hypothetical protein [Nocardia cyriacigeorgica]